MNSSTSDDVEDGEPHDDVEDGLGDDVILEAFS